MENPWMQGFHWAGEELFSGTSDAETAYQALVRWAGEARGKNPSAFDAMTEWLLDDGRWTAGSLAENKSRLLGVLDAFQSQTLRLRRRLKELQPSGVVNPAVFSALDRMEAELTGRAPDQHPAVRQMLADFSAMADPALRRQIAGGKTGPTGTDTVAVYGYLNTLKDCDAGVQWALFMPDVVKAQQKGFSVESFEYRKMPALRFLGRAAEEVPALEDRRAVFAALDALGASQPDLRFDVLLIHHGGAGVDVARPRLLWGRFMQPDAPCPPGLTALDFLPEPEGGPGAPYVSQFAYAVFSGDDAALHQREGFDSDAMYDVTRNIMLAQNVTIPYPDKYWVAEAFLNGHEKSSTAYLFSALL